MAARSRPARRSPESGAGAEPVSAKDVAEGRRLFAAPCRFFAAVSAAAELPAGTLPEIAFAGRSNVGKSSLIGALAGRPALVRTSRTPGRTRTLNFFELDSRLRLVDLPGYGYAHTSKREAAAFFALASAYLKGRRELRRVLLLVDARHGPKPSDRAFMAALDEAAAVYQIVLTKSDKVPADTLARLSAALARELPQHPAAHPEIAATSALERTGLERLRAELARLARRP